MTRVSAEKNNEGKVNVSFSDKEELVMDEEYTKDIQDCVTGLLGVTALLLANNDQQDAMAIINKIAGDAVAVAQATVFLANDANNV